MTSFASKEGTDIMGTTRGSKIFGAPDDRDDDGNRGDGDEEDKEIGKSAEEGKEDPRFHQQESMNSLFQDDRSVEFLGVGSSLI